MMTLKTFLTLSIAIFLLTACNDEKTSKETTTTVTDTNTSSLPSKQDKIKTADALMAQIEAAKEEQQVEKKRYSNPTDGHDQSIYVVYSQNGEMVKLTENLGESMYLADVVYYYQDGAIFLIHTVNFFDDNWYNETKVYFENGQPIAAVGRSKEEQDMDTDLASLPMKAQELSKAIYDMENYMASLSKIPTRLAASTPE